MPNEKKIIFYHVASNTKDLKSFFREGAKSVLLDSNTKYSGFYVWSNEDDADNHIRLLEGGFLNKHLNNQQALIIGIQISKDDFKYPNWQIDTECAPGLLELLRQNSTTINDQLNNLNINLAQNDSLLKNISKISCQNKENKTEFIFHGKTSIGTNLSYTLTYHINSNPCKKSLDAFYIQTLVDTLCTGNPEFQIKYNKLMYAITQFHGAFKYIGKEPLPIFIIKNVDILPTGIFEKNVIFDTSKGIQQVCPFLKIKNRQH